MMWGMHGTGNMMWGYGWGGLLMWLFFFVLVVVLVVAIWRIIPGGRAGEASSQESALDIARRRYAKGEIGREEFEEIRRTLTE